MCSPVLPLMVKCQDMLHQTQFRANVSPFLRSCSHSYALISYSLDKHVVHSAHEALYPHASHTSRTSISRRNPCYILRNDEDVSIKHQDLWRSGSACDSSDVCHTLGPPQGHPFKSGQVQALGCFPFLSFFSSLSFFSCMFLVLKETTNKDKPWSLFCSISQTTSKEAAGDGTILVDDVFIKFSREMTKELS